MNRIKEVRKKKGLSLQQVADAVGVGNNTISRYETGKREPKLETWNKLANALGVSVAYLQGFPEETEGQKLCPYCHTDIEIDSCSYEKVQVPEKCLFNYEHDHFIASISIFNGKLIASIIDDLCVWEDGPKIKFCPMCGRRLGDKINE